MAFNNKFIILCIINISLFINTINAVISSPHILTSVYEDIVEKNGNYTLLCQGTKPLKWTYPKVDRKHAAEFPTKITIEKEKPNNPLYKYGLRLYITNMTFPYVGFYTCHNQDTDNETNNIDQNNRVYLFIDDPEKLAVFYDDDLHKLENVHVIQNHVAVIPCRPTSPEVKVTLSSDSLIIKPNILTRENTIYQYSPFYGFSTNDTMEIGPVWYDCLFVRDLGNHTVLHKTHYMDFDYEFDNKLGFSFELLGASQYGIYVCTFSNDELTFDIYFNVDLEDPHTSYIPTPILTDENYGHTTVGGDIQLKCKLPTARSEVIFAWDVPSGNFDSTRMNQTDLEEDVEVSSILTITNVTFEDNGTYVCRVSDYQDHNESKNISIKIFDIGENYIKMREVTDNYYFEAKSGQESVIFSVQVWGHPQSNFTWLNNNNETIKEGKGKKYEVKTSKGLITLKIRNIDLSNDFGYYSLVGRNDYLEKTLTFFLNVTDKPTVTIHIENFYLVGEVGKVQCTAAAHPIPELKWEYKNCLKPDCFFREIPGDIINEEGLTVSSEVTLNVTETGVVKCTATNSLGTESEKKEYHVTDVVDGFGITGFENNVVIKNETKQAIFAVTERIIASCRASILKYKNLTWLLNDTKVQEDERHSLIYGKTDYSYEVQIKIVDIDYADTGIYSCRTFNHLDEPLFKNMSFLITDSIPVKIIESNMVDEMIEDFPKPVSFRCMVEGIPKPNILWYKNDKIFEPNDKRIHFDYGNQILVFTETEINDQGEYKCKAYYKDSSDFRKIQLKFRNAPAAMGTWLIYIIIFLILLLAIVVIYLFLRVRKEKRLKREMKLLGLANFEKGAVENINPELGIDDQAELLPYDRKWEFPIEQLKLGKQLGSGAFGVVLKGEAKNIIEGEPVTTVAVKMVKKNADNTYIKALASELKIMVHLGKHLNVVNLLGACTKNVAKRELLVIVEYCRFGNLQNFLLRHRDHFIDQIDPNTGKVNYNIGQEELLDRTYSMSSNRSATHSPLLKYAALVFSDSANNSHVPSANAMGDYRTQPEGAGTTETTTITQGDDHIILSNNSIQPEWRSNYKGDYKGTVSPISTKDLIAWSFQIARGMEYLASRKVLHGDLAARNILLTEDNIVKICDFGLAKSMYKSDNYKKRGDCPLPVKWMAIESIRDRVFSTQSDVWSFGIVLWEIFSLGRTPYPGMEADERLYYKLVDGYRLESPDYAPNDLYKIMTECWSAKPTFRPTFTKLTEKIGTLLEDTLRKHYIDLNDPYLAMNTRMLENQNDYLAMLCPPTFEAVATPNYVNDIVVADPQGSIDSGYMSMKPNNIFSPRLEDDEIFDFSVSNRKNDEDADNVPELLPMLTMKEELDKENCPKVNSVSNPSYHLPPIIDDRNTEIVVSNHNYVNMPQNKHLLKDNKTNLNIDNKKNEVHYINDNVQDWDSIKV